MRTRAASTITTELKAKSRRRREALVERQTARRSTAPPRNDLTPNLQLVTRPVSLLRSFSRRIRKADRAHIETVKRAIASLGQCVPLLINGADEVIDGEIRLQAARELELPEIWCIVVDHLTSEELRLLRLQVNRLQERGEWDLDVLRLEFTELLELDLPLEVTGFSLPEIDQIILAEEGEDDEHPEDLEPGDDAVCRPGDLWALGDHMIACGDARDADLVKSLFDGVTLAALVLTDPPFNVPIAGHVTSGDHEEFAMASGEMSREEFALFNKEWMAAVLPHLRDGGLLAPFIDWRSVTLMIQAGEALELVLLNLVVWAKTNAGMGALWRSQHELLPVLKKGRAPHTNNIELGRYGRWRSNVWSYPGASSLGSDARAGLAEHPTTKPVAMLEDALLDVTHPGDIVVDPFLGSGSTLIAAEKAGRRCRAIELEPRYVDVAVRRWITLTGGEPRLVRSHANGRGAKPLLLPSPAALVVAGPRL